jgi:hypothetical protein
MSLRGLGVILGSISIGLLALVLVLVGTRQYYDSPHIQHTELRAVDPSGSRPWMWSAEAKEEKIYASGDKDQKVYEATKVQGIRTSLVDHLRGMALWYAPTFPKHSALNLWSQVSIFCALL